MGPIPTPSASAVRIVRRITSRDPACAPQAMLADDTTSRIASSWAKPSPSCSPRSALRSIERAEVKVVRRVRPQDKRHAEPYETREGCARSLASHRCFDSGHDDRMVRLLHLRKSCNDPVYSVLSSRQRHREFSQNAGDIRGRFRSSSLWRAVLRTTRRPRRQKIRVSHDASIDGRLDGRNRFPPRLLEDRSRRPRHTRISPNAAGTGSWR